MIVKTRNWVFTENNYTEEIYNGMKVWIDDEKVRYVILGKEVGEEGTPHIQGYVSFNYTVSLAAVKKFSARAHWEVMRGTPLQASEYCKKEGNYEEFGVIPVSREEKALKEHEKWKQVIAAAETGQCKDLYPGEWVRYNTTLKKMYVPELPEYTEYSGEWFYGPTGTGKSRRAREKNPNHYIKQKNKWWDGYENEEVIIIDDVTKDHSKIGHYLLNWVDHYPFPAEYKGGCSRYRPKKIIVTSNYAIEQVFEEMGEESVKALKRRFRVSRFERSKDSGCTRIIREDLAE